MSLTYEKQRYLNETLMIIIGKISIYHFVKNFLFRLFFLKKKKIAINDFGSDKYSYSIFLSDPRISEYSDTRRSPTDNDVKRCQLNDAALVL